MFFVPGTNAPAAGYKLFTYIAGTSTKQATWTDSTQTVQNANPTIADANGVMMVWPDPTLKYKYILSPPNDTDPPSSPIYSVDNIQGPVTLSILTQGLIGSILYPQTPAEIAAGVTPVNYAYPELYAPRYGWSESASAATNATALNNAIAVASKYSTTGATVQLPPGIFSLGTNLIYIPTNVIVNGAGMVATRINSDNTGLYAFSLGGPLSGSLKYGCGLSNLRIELSQTNGKSVQLMETVGAQVKNLYIEGPVSASRSTQGVVIDGGNASAFFNVLNNVLCNHIHVGFDLLTSGTKQPTQQFFIECTSVGDVATDTSSIGYRLQGGGAANGTGAGSLWLGGNFESCGTGVYYTTGCGSSTMQGGRFEGNTVDVLAEGAPGAQTLMGCWLNTTGTGISDASGGNALKFIGCQNGANQFDRSIMPGEHLLRSILTGQIPLRISAFPGDTTTNEFTVEDSSGNVLFAVTAQGKISRINNSGPVTVNAASTDLPSVIALCNQLRSTLIADGICQ